MRGLCVFSLCLVLACTKSRKETIYPKGGYNYIRESSRQADSNFYFLPARNSISREDSVQIAFWVKLFYQSFNEPNLSLEPKEHSILRLSYLDAMRLTSETVISLTENKIEVKRRVTEDSTPALDENNLNQLERYHFNLIRSYHLLDRGPNYSKKLNHRLDSIIKVYPILNDTRYHVYLYNKALKKSEASNYTTKTIQISKSVFNSLVDSINLSGYWTLPVNVPCKYPPMDGDGFTLEANTPQKYNVVTLSSCEERPDKFVRACQLLIKAAGLDNEIKL